jgi:hypothetical protein
MVVTDDGWKMKHVSCMLDGKRSIEDGEKVGLGR